MNCHDEEISRYLRSLPAALREEVAADISAILSGRAEMGALPRFLDTLPPDLKDKVAEDILALWIQDGYPAGLPIYAVAESLWKVPALGAGERPLPHLHLLPVRDGSRKLVTEGSSFKREEDRGRPEPREPWCETILLRVGTNASVEGVTLALLHELVHAAMPWSKSHHGPAFQRRLIATAAEAFGLQLDRKKLLALPKGLHECRAYAITVAIEETLRENGGNEIVIRMVERYYFSGAAAPP